MEKLRGILKKVWGYDRFLPLQEPAMTSVLKGRDSVVVLPTGGGKSLCFQAPAVALPGMAVVVSPLISLMKDQVDALTSYGVPAAFLNSSLSYDERDLVLGKIQSNQLKLLYVAPERLLAPGFLDLLKATQVSTVAIDEAHCISMWGHDFRPEYRELSVLKKAFGNTAIHAYTATATEQVRSDIVRQLRLDRPEIIVGSFDRPNLIYRVKRREGLGVKQIREILDRHRDESGIIYGIRRADVEELSRELNGLGYKTLPYHAGLPDETRKDHQNQFIREKVETIVATIAFGMGIDKSNVRYVIHAAMPKSLEHYQQESGRAGRDRLEAECWLFYSGADYSLWQSILGKNEPENYDVAQAKLSAMYNFCSGVTCRHEAILNYFGQSLGKNNCEACDVCLEDLNLVSEPLVLAQKIISCVLRLKESFGGDYTAQVLIGSTEQRILDNGHDKLSTYNLLGDYNKRIVRDWIEQLAAQGYLEKVGEYNVLRVTEKGWGVLKAKHVPKLLKPAAKKPKNAKHTKAAAASWEGVDEALFERLRKLRRKLADERAVPAFIVFGDAALRDMARQRPTTQLQFAAVHGVGKQKCEDYAEIFTQTIREYLADHPTSK